MFQKFCRKILNMGPKKNVEGNGKKATPEELQRIQMVCFLLQISCWLNLNYCVFYTSVGRQKGSRSWVKSFWFEKAQGLEWENGF